MKLVYQTGTTAREEPGGAEALPFLLRVEFSPPEFMNVLFAMLYGGTEEVHVRAASAAELDELVQKEQWESHPRLRRFVITGPDGEIRRGGPRA
jgi:hypothetical protein